MVVPLKTINISRENYENSSKLLVILYQGAEYLSIKRNILADKPSMACLLQYFFDSFFFNYLLIQIFWNYTAVYPRIKYKFSLHIAIWKRTICMLQ